MKKIVLLILMVLLVSLNLLSQNDLGMSVTAEERLKFEAAIQTYSKEIRSLESDLIIEKTSSLISEKSITRGRLFFETPSKLRWETFGDNAYSLVVNDGVAAIRNASGELLNNSKMLKNLGNFIINIINGKNLSSTKEFRSEFYKHADNIILQLIPNQKNIKDLYTEIIIEINTKNYLADKIIMYEKSNDIMTIFLNDKQTNNKIAQDKFKVN
jgi:outer membrane lipoprotein carrier protein